MTPKPWVRWTCLVAVLAAGLGFRVANYADVRPQNPDEAMYLRQARFMASLGRMAVGAPGPVINESASGIWRYVRKSDWYCKPCWLHSGLMALPMAFAGNTAPAGLVVNLVFSLGAVVLVYLSGRRLFGEMAGLAGAGLLAVSHYWLVYSRSFYAEVDAVCLVLLGFYLIVRVVEHTRMAWVSFVLAGVAAACACLAHYRLLFVVAPLGLSILVLASNWRSALNQGVIFGVTFCLTLAVVELGLRVVAGAAGPGVPFSGLFGALAEQYLPEATGKAPQTGWQPMNVLAYVGHLLRWQGYAGFGALVLGSCAALAPGMRRKGIAVLGMIAVPLVVLTLQVWVVARSATVMLPFTCIMAGYGIGLLFDAASSQARGYKPRLIFVVALVACVVGVAENGYRNSALLRNETGYASVGGALVREGVKTVYAMRETADVLGWYAPSLTCLRLRDIPSRPMNPSTEVAIFDGMAYHYYPGSRRPITEREAQIALISDVSTTANMTATWRHFLFDGTQAHSLSALRESIRNADPGRVATIRVYRALPETTLEENR